MHEKIAVQFYPTPKLKEPFRVEQDQMYICQTSIQDFLFDGIFAIQLQCKKNHLDNEGQVQGEKRDMHNLS